MKKRILAALLALAMLPAAAGAVHAAPADTDTYTVKPGDTMWIISVKYQIGLSEIINANPSIANPHWIYPGQRLTIPLMTGTKSVESQVAQLVNAERAKAGLKPLTLNWQLSRVARVKSEDMRDKAYFSHQSPTYGSPFEMMKAFGLSYSYAGENIAAGQTTAQAVMTSWMNSPGHKANILSPNFTEIGVGYAAGGSMRHYWTQQFIKP
ncbi:putative YkwD family protein/spore coat assembly protein SafA [Paenibacillus phyllosphaerae]|uniref:Putative YkwD family protein/spore coat assembly protein SafA n=1 Tax=Paenibacillus phyllosphaerae TaxID=274593 RepID=A0A7W5ATP4_9BACL|nr:CAP domain-containing protein [Paenibacillus phyllosphaerae]MBB3108488.1 putative YkwD family protein/spore coat assembly protein SafA [Paenibacillus phyllosphaerae]